MKKSPAAKDKRMWVVRAEVGGKYFDEFKTKSIVAIGWVAMGDLALYRTREDFNRAANQAYPDIKKMQRAVWAGQTYRFVREMQIGDLVVTYDPSRRVYLVGTVASDYFRDTKLIEEDPNCRRVNWIGEVPRDALSVSTKNSLGAISTLFVVPEEAAGEINARLESPQATERPIEPEDEQTAVENIFKDSQAQAREFIKDKLGRLDWDEMQTLVAGILRAMGYKTRISPSGPDRGKDIVASPDGFGFESPRIVVEVKHRTTSAMGSQEIRSFLGGRHKDDKGLYVSTGGFSKDARYEAERASIPVALMDLDDLVAAMLEHYEKMEPEVQRLVPLRRVYWPN
jgi:restriction system protein